MKSQSEMIGQMAKNADESLIKGRDLPLFNKVKKFLNDRGLEVELRGSVVSNALKGMPRQYGDIDMLVKDNCSTRFIRASFDLVRSFNGVLGCNEPLARYVTDHSNMGHLYVMDRVDQRFTLKDGKTIIDLSFQTPITGLKDVYNREVPSQYLSSKSSK